MNNQAIQFALRNIITADAIKYQSNISVWGAALAKAILQHFGEDPTPPLTGDEMDAEIARLNAAVLQKEEWLYRLHERLNDDLSYISLAMIKSTIVAYENSLDEVKQKILKLTAARLGLEGFASAPESLATLETNVLQFTTGDLLALIKDAIWFMPTPLLQEEHEAIALLNKAAGLLTEASKAHPEQVGEMTPNAAIDKLFGFAKGETTDE